METMEAKNKAFLVENVAAIDRLQSSNEKAIGGLRSDHEKAIGELRSDLEKAIGELRTAIQGNARNLLVQMILVIGAGVGILALILK